MTEMLKNMSRRIAPKDALRLLVRLFVAVLFLQTAAEVVNSYQIFGAQDPIELKFLDEVGRGLFYVILSLLHPGKADSSPGEQPE